MSRQIYSNNPSKIGKPNTKKTNIKDKIKPDLDNLITLYNKEKKLSDEHTKNAENYNKQIKSEFQSREIKEYFSDNYTVKMSINQRAEFNEPQAIEILRNALTPEQFSSVVKQKEYLDGTVLDDMLSQKIINPELLVPCSVPMSPVIKLRIIEKK